MSEWPFRKVGEICSLIRGVSFDKEASRTTPAVGFIALLRAGNIAGRLETERDLLYVPEARVSPQQRLRTGDIAICMSSGSPAVVGKTARLESSWSGTVGAFLAIIRPGPDADSEYLSWLFRSRWFTDWRDGRARGANIQNLRVSEIAQLAAPLPPLPEQRRIAAKLTGVMAEVTRARVASHDRLAAAGDWDAAVLRSCLPARPPVLGDSSEPAAAPMGWEWVLLTEVARLESGHTPSRKRPDWWVGDVPWLALPDIRAWDGQVITSTSETTNADGLANSSARLLPEGTVALSRTASVGFVTIFGKPMATSQDFVNWVCGDRLRPRFLLHALRASREHLLQIASGAIHKTIYMNTVERFRLCLPSVSEQDAIVARIDDQLGLSGVLRPSLEEEWTAIEQLPGKVLEHVFSGK